MYNPFSTGQTLPPILKLLSENKETKRLEEIFSYFEEIVNNNDLLLMNIFSITVMEMLVIDKSILEHLAIWNVLKILLVN